MTPICSQETQNLELQNFINYLKGIDQVSNTISMPDFMTHNIVDKLKILSPIRALSKVSQTIHDRLDVVIDNNDTESGWVKDILVQNDKKSTLSKVSIYLHQMFARPKVSCTLIEDAASKVDEVLKDKITTQMSIAENFAFLYGDGITQPHGILKYEIVTEKYNSASKTLEGIKTKLPINSDILIKLIELLQTKYLCNATWLMSRNVASNLRTLKDNASGQFIWQNSILNNMPDTLLGYPVVICDDMPKLSDKGIQILFGNFYSGYQIAEKPEITLLKDPFNSKPFVEFYATKRVGGDVVDFNAFKVLVTE